MWYKHGCGEFDLDSDLDQAQHNNYVLRVSSKFIEFAQISPQVNFHLQRVAQEEIRIQSDQVAK